MTSTSPSSRTVCATPLFATFDPVQLDECVRVVEYVLRDLETDAVFAPITSLLRGVPFKPIV